MASYSEYLKAAMRRAEYERLEDGSGFYAHIAGFDGLWASGYTIGYPGRTLRCARRLALRERLCEPASAAISTIS